MRSLTPNNMKEFAEQYFLQRKGNCAQAVFAAWNFHSQKQDINVNECAVYGHGKAPGGLCGALYAALHIAGDRAESEIKKGFAEKSGEHFSCADIRAARSLRCIDCVTLAASLLEEHTSSFSVQSQGE